MFRKFLTLTSIATALLCLNCGSSEDGGSSGDGSNGPPGIEGARGSCTALSDCASGEICLASPETGGACVPTCNGNGNECSATASCGQLGTVSVSVCKTEAPEGEGEGTSTEAEEAYVPCQSDAECQALGEGAICATDSHGQRGCTALCSTEEHCNTPSLGGVSVDFFSCQVDRSDTTRHGCFVDPKCENDPLSCTSGFQPGTGGNVGTGGGDVGTGGDFGTGAVPGVGGFTGL